MTPHHTDANPAVDVLAASLTEAGQRPSEMQGLFARTDWAATPLGPVQNWPSRLRHIVDTCLSSRFPMLVCWGPDLLMIYNDGYRTMLGESKHPSAWAAPAREAWPEVWDVIGPMFAGVLDGGPATWVEDEMLTIDRYGFIEEAYFTWSFGAIHDDPGDRVVGILTVATEVTDRVLAERRAQVSAQLVAALADADTIGDVRRQTLRVLASHTEDHVGVDLVWVEGAIPGPTGSASLHAPGGSALGGLRG